MWKNASPLRGASRLFHCTKSLSVRPFVCSVLPVVILRHWLRELFVTDFSKPGIYTVVAGDLGVISGYYFVRCKLFRFGRGRRAACVSRSCEFCVFFPCSCLFFCSLFVFECGWIGVCVYFEHIRRTACIRQACLVYLSTRDNGELVLKMLPFASPAACLSLSLPLYLQSQDEVYRFPYMEVCLTEGNGCDWEGCMETVNATVSDPCGRDWNVQVPSPEEVSSSTQ